MFRSPTPIVDMFLFALLIAFVFFSLDGYDVRVAQSCQYSQNFVNNFHHKILLLQPLLLLNQAVVGNLCIQPDQIKCM